MPHLHLDYSPNLAERLDIAALCRTLAQAAAATGVFPRAGIRVRAVAANYSFVADGNPDHAYLDLSVRLRGGRDLAVRRAATQAIFAALESFCAPVMATSSLMLSMEMRDIDPDLSPKASSVRDHLPKDFQ